MANALSKTIYVSEETSQKIQKVSFVAFVMVVMIHSQVFGLIDNFPRLHKLILGVVFQELTAWAVPWFFALSGFFFFQRISSKKKDDLWTCSFWRQFYLSKLKSLVCPYIVWTIICTLFLLPITIGANYINGRELFDLPIRHGSALEFIVDVFGVVSLKGPQFAGHLWFLRSLILLFLSAPLLACFARLNLILKWLILFLLLGFHLYNIPWVISAFWFLLGGIVFPLLLNHNFTVTQKSVCIIGWLGCLIGGALFGEGCKLAVILKLNGIVFGIFSFIGIINSKRDYNFIKPTFFYYCNHLLFTTWTMYGLLFLNHTSFFWGGGATIITTIIGVIGPILLHNLLCRWKFPWMNILSGGRV